MKEIMNNAKTQTEEKLRKLEEQSGQSLIILAFAFVGLIAMLGLALDLGLVYVERVRIKRTVDAAILASVVELPVEEQAFDRAIRDPEHRFNPGTTADLIAASLFVFLTEGDGLEIFPDLLVRW